MLQYDITQEDIDKFKAMRDYGMSLKQIQRMYKYPTRKAKYIVDTLKKEYPRMTITKKILCAYEEGGSIEEIAEAYDANEDYVMQCLRFYGYQFKTQDSTTKSIVSDLKEGLSARKICEKYGVSRQWVHQCKRDYIECNK